MAQLQDKVALVTGAAAGIGKEIALTFGREGAKVAIADLNLAAAQATVDELASLGIAGMAVAMDVANEQAVEDGVAAVIASSARRSSVACCGQSGLARMKSVISPNSAPEPGET